MSTIIYQLLESKPHNPHYLNRYITFIEQCQQKNIGYDGYAEGHHILPRADDMFPEYKDFRLHPWNFAVLTARQHFIAHLILWKAFPDTTSCLRALKFMCDNKSKWGYYIYSKTYEKLKNNLSIQMTIRMKNSVWVNDGSREYMIQKNDDISAYNIGRLNFRKECFMINNGAKNKMHHKDDEIPTGWEMGMFQNTFMANNKKVQRRVTKVPSGWKRGGLKNLFRWIHKGSKEKRIGIDDIIPKGWSEGRKPNLINKKLISNGIEEIQIDLEEKIPAGWILGSIKTFKKGKGIVITNGTEDRRIRITDEIPEGWYRGTSVLCKNRSVTGKMKITNGYVDTWLPVDEEIPEGWSKGSYRESTNRSKIWITDGNKNKRIKPENEIPAAWNIGFTQNQTKRVWITDGNKNRKITKYDTIPEGWSKGFTPLS
jgi:uncharacterized protein YbdZ (MbtH family)